MRNWSNALRLVYMRECVLASSFFSHFYHFMNERGTTYALRGYTQLASNIHTHIAIMFIHSHQTPTPHSYNISILCFIRVPDPIRNSFNEWKPINPESIQFHAHWKFYDKCGLCAVCVWRACAMNTKADNSIHIHITRIAETRCEVWTIKSNNKPQSNVVWALRKYFVFLLTHRNESATPPNSMWPTCMRWDVDDGTTTAM